MPPPNSAYADPVDREVKVADFVITLKHSIGNIGSGPARGTSEARFCLHAFHLYFILSFLFFLLLLLFIYFFVLYTFIWPVVGPFWKSLESSIPRLGKIRLAIATAVGGHQNKTR